MIIRIQLAVYSDLVIRSINSKNYPLLFIPATMQFYFILKNLILSVLNLAEQIININLENEKW